MAEIRRPKENQIPKPEARRPRLKQNLTMSIPFDPGLHEHGPIAQPVESLLPRGQSLFFGSDPMHYLMVVGEMLEPGIVFR